jgi:hypothetical protein
MKPVESTDQNMVTPLDLSPTSSFSHHFLVCRQGNCSLDSTLSVWTQWFLWESDCKVESMESISCKTKVSIYRVLMIQASIIKISYIFMYVNPQIHPVRCSYILLPSFFSHRKWRNKDQVAFLDYNFWSVIWTQGVQLQNLSSKPFHTQRWKETTCFPGDTGKILLG